MCPCGYRPLANDCREQLYTDIRLNDTLCELYKVHMEKYGKSVLKSHDKVMTGSSDIGMHYSPRCESVS